MTELTPLEKLINRQEIVDIIYRYARGSDRIDVDLFSSAFWDDGDSVDGKPPQTRIQVSEAVLEDFMNGLFSITHHCNTNVLVDFIGVDRAQVETYFVAFHLTRSDIGKAKLDSVIGVRRVWELGGGYDRSYEIVVGGRYLDQFEKRNEQWRIKERRLVFDWTTTNLASGLDRNEGFLATAQATLFGGRDRTDPSYSFHD